MQIHNAIITGSFSYNGADLSNVTSSNAYSASLSSRTTDLESTSSVLVGASSSFSSILSSVSSSQQQLSSSFLTLTASFNAVSASQQQISASYIALSASYNTFSGSASTRITVDSASLLQVSSSQQQISASLLNVISIFATTGSNSFRETQSITGSLTVTGQIIAQTLNVQQVTSSIIYSSGSNNFGCDLNSRQTFTGSVLITGSLTIAGASSATSYSGATIFGSTIACSPIGCFATSCATAFIGGTMSGTTIYGSTAVCSPVGKFTTCLDLGGALTGTSGTFSGILSSSGGDIRSTGTAADSVTAGPFISVRNASNAYQMLMQLNASYGLDIWSYGGAWDKRMTITSTGIACFACQVCAPNLLISNCATIGTVGFSYPEFRLAVTPIMTVVGAGCTPTSEGIYFKRTSNLCQGGWISGNGGALYLVGQNKHATAFGNIYFSSNDGTTTCDVMVIDGVNQRVGIGTTTPYAKFEVLGGNQCPPSTGTQNYTMALRDPTSMVCGVGGSILFQGYKTGTAAIGNFAYIAGKKENGTAGNEAGYISLGSFDSAGNTAERMRITSAGQIYFNRFITSSTDVINIEGGSSFSGRGILINMDAGNDALTIGGSGTQNAINVTNSSKKVIISNLGGSGTVTVQADNNGTLVKSSDSSLKQEHKDYKIQGLAEILQLQPRAYKWLKDIEVRKEEAVTEIGFFADEVNPIIPSAAPKGFDGLYGFNDRAVTAALVKAIQEQQCTINTLKTCLGIN